ncbi:hypothetical protein [Thermostaphylospora chromogena]|uniref:PE-PGRS family protein n=1 Tax=Thermostaphylospora chromogena TaxID=35622 RepID=A0A1H1CKK4_9ACTN|nr:hypothetical protein [Thermostaphylospora chromogena]SDQ64693.1 hypothetical protein SAMN04489764_1523 [Thermostaphylospora chromogena]
MGGGDFRSFHPDQLERLADLMEDLFISADEAFARAANLQVSTLLTPIREMPRWARDTGRDLRRRAAIGRLQTGDPFAGLAWAGFSPLEIAAKGDKIDPASLVYVNSVADWATTTGNTDYSRRPGESLDDYLNRLQAAALSHAIPALQPHEATVANVLKVVGDVRQISVTVPVVATQSLNLGRVMLNNKAWRPLIASITKKSPVLTGKTIRARSLSAPRTYLGDLIRNLLMRSSLYRDSVARLPKFREMDAVDIVVNSGRALAGMRVNRFLDLAFGNNRLAAVLGGKTHAGVPVKTSGQANLLKVWAATGDPKKMEAAAAVLKVKPNELSRIGAVARTAGALRGLGIAGGVASTAYSAANVISQGDPIKAFERRGAGYVADLAEVGFNASLTAAMIAPNPLTIGVTVATGAVFVGAKVVEHWDDIKEGAKKAVDAVGTGLKKAGDFIKSLNPFS